jgi:SpoVK/Ycf46/Vps4 family AAA+-type ATPase
MFKIHLRRRGRNPEEFDVAELARACDGFSGAEIEEAIISALFDSFSRQVPLDTGIVKASLAETVPLSKTMNEELTRLRNWAAGRARPASGVAPRTNEESRRKIEL